MQARMVDALKVHRAKVRAVRQKHQNVESERIAGLAKIELLKELGLWEAEVDEENPDLGCGGCGDDPVSVVDGDAV